MFTGTPTKNLGLPNYNPNDHPDFLTDFNNAFKALDDKSLQYDEEIQYLTRQCNELNEKLNQLKLACGITSAGK